MSMLAERKVKQRWSLNPRGTNWLNDTNNFGHKMLSKMGWSHGKGLGAKENGITEQIKVSYKNDSKGMGYKVNDEQWQEHEMNFSALLETLSNNNNSSSSNDKKLVSLEEKSQTSKARVHYKKFTRGKDLSQYSEKDLANIFGKKSLNNLKNEEKLEKTFLQNSGSMVDYFKQKLSKLQTNIDRESDDNDENPVRYGFGFNSQSSMNGGIIEENWNEKKRKLDDDIEPKIKKKKVENSMVAIDNPVFDETVNSRDFCNENYEVSRKMKKKQKKIDGNLGNSPKINDAIDNPVFSGQDSSLENSKEFVENVVPKKTKKVKRKSTETFDGNMGTFPENNGAIDNPVFNGEDSSLENLENSKEFVKNNESSDVVRKKTKKVKRKSTEAFDGNAGTFPKNNGAIDNPVFNGHDSSLENLENSKEFVENHENLEMVPKKTKKVKRKSTEAFNGNVANSPKNNGAIDNPVFGSQDDSLENLETAKEVVANNENFEMVRKKTKKMKRKSTEVFDGNVGDSPENNGAIDNPVFNGQDSNLENLETSKELVGNSENFEVVSNKTKKIKRKSMEAIDNPAFDGNMGDSPKNSNGNFEVIRNDNKKKKKIKETTMKTKKIVRRKSTESLENSPQQTISVNGTKKKIVSKKSTENSPEKQKKKKKKKIVDNHGIDNVVFNGNTQENSTNFDKNYEVSRKNLKNSKIPLDNPCFNNNFDCSGYLNQTPPPPATTTIGDEICCDLMLNTITTPILKTPTTTNRNNLNKKSVRFSDKNQKHIIPNNDDIEKLNELTIINTKIINNNLTKLSKRLDGLEAEIENDMNQAKLEQINNNNNDNNNNSGGVVIKFNNNVKWGSVPIWLLKTKCKAKSSYKHLIKGDIVVNFKNTNFDQIQGYGSTSSNSSSSTSTNAQQKN